MNKNKCMIAYIIFFIIILFFISFWSAFPLELKKGESVIIMQGETVEEDLYIKASAIRVDGTVNGDLWIMGGQVSIDGQINGSIYVLCSSASIRGEVRGGIKVIGMDILISAQIGRDAFLMGSQIIFNRDTFIGGDTLFAGKEVDVKGEFKNNVYGIGKKLVLNSLINGEVKFWTRDLEVRSNTRIGGGLFYRSEKNAVIFPGAEIHGKIMKETPSEIGPRGSFISYLLKINPYLWVVMRFFSGLLLGIFFIMLTPRIMGRVANTVYENPLSSFLWGFLITIVAPIFSIMAFVLIIGIPVSLIIIAVYTLIVSAGTVGFEIFIGRFLLKKTKFERKRKILLVCNIVGLVILSFVRLIPVVGSILLILILIIGSGSVIRAFLGMRTRGEIEIRT